MTGALFDTNIAIDWLRSVPQAGKEIVAYESPYLSRVAWIEVLVGVGAESLPIALGLLDSFVVIELTEPISRQAVVVRQQFRKLKLPDAIIYATAQVHGLTLVTRNTRDFNETMPGVRIPYTV